MLQIRKGKDGKERKYKIESIILDRDKQKILLSK